MRFSKTQLAVLIIGVVLCIFIRVTAVFGTDTIEPIDLRDGRHYHREVILLNRFTKSGGLYLQIEDAPFCLKKVEVVINYLPVRMVHIKGEAYPVVPETKGSIFGFMKEKHPVLPGVFAQDLSAK